MPEFDRLLLFRALRPDRLTAAMRKFVTNMIGTKYVTSQPYDLERSFQDSSPGTPIFVFLSPGVDVVSDKQTGICRLSHSCHSWLYPLSKAASGI
jgi:dynein heavy chain